MHADMRGAGKLPSNASSQARKVPEASAPILAAVARLLAPDAPIAIPK